MDQVTERRALVDDIVFRAAEEGDLETLKDLYAQLIPDEDPGLDDMCAALAHIQAHPEAGMVVVGTIGGVVVATCQIILYANLVRAPRWKAEVDSVVVDADYRGLGIGGRMMVWVMDLLADRNCAKIIVATSYEREIAHRMYHKLGFDRSGYGFIYTYPRR